MNKTLSRLTSFAVMLIMLLSLVPFRSYAVEVVSSDIKITDFTKPEGNLPVGKSFILKGIITSKEPMKKVVAGIYYRNGVANQEVEKEVNKTEFDIKTIDAGIRFGSLPEGLYCYQIGVTDSNDNYIRLLYSEFQVGNPSAESEIKTENSSFPSGTMQYGQSFKINCCIKSVQPLNKVYAYIYNSNNLEVWKTAKSSVNSKSYTFSGNDIFDIANLDVGSYTYKLIAEDYSGYNVTLEKINFEVKKSEKTDSDIKISNAEFPSGNLKQGSYFNLRGIITSKYKLKTVVSEILKSDGTVLQKVSFSPDSTTFNVFPDIDYSMIFENLDTGKYIFLIQAEDEKGFKEDVVKSDFEIGESNILAGDANIDGKVDIADVIAISSYVSDSEHNFLQPVGRQNGDVQNSGNGLNASDALMIQQYLAGIITSLK